MNTSSIRISLDQMLFDIDIQLTELRESLNEGSIDNFYYSLRVTKLLNQQDTINTVINLLSQLQ